MYYTEQLREWLARQKDQLETLEQSVQLIEQTDVNAENDRLRLANEIALQEAARLADENKRLTEDNAQLNADLQARLLAEKLGIAGRSKGELLIYFGRTAERSDDRLTALELKYRGIIKQLSDSLEKDVAKTEEITAQCEKALRELRALRRKKEQAVQAAMTAEMDELSAQPLSPGAAERLRRFNIEMRFGTKIVSVMGALLILLGVVFGLQYTYVNLLRSNELKSAAAYMLGFLFLAGGEWSRRKLSSASRVTNSFAVGLSAGGLGILFASTAVSYFSLQVIPALPAAGLCVLFSLLSFWFSVRYNARTIACLALVGGYLTLSALPHETAAVNAAFIFVTLLNLLTLLIATRKKWPVVNGLSFACYTLGTLFLLLFFYGRIGTVAVVAYLMLNFFLYLTAVLLYPATHKTEADASAFTWADIIILAADTVISCIFLYAFFNADRVTPFAFNGLLAVLFCAAYYAAMRAVTRFLPDEKRIKILFGLTALAFALLVIPFQFGLNGLLVGWLAEGTLLLCYGVLWRDKWFERAGVGVTALAAVIFLPQLMAAAGYLPWSGINWIRRETRFFVHFSLMVAGCAAIASVYYLARRAVEPSRQRGVLNIFYYVAVVFGLMYVLYAAAFIYIRVTPSDLPTRWLSLLLVMCGFVYGFGIKYLPVPRGRGALILSMCVTKICAWSALYVNSSDMYNPARPVASLGLLMVFNLFAAAAVYDCVCGLRTLTRPGKAWLPLVSSVYALVLITMVLMVQYGYNANSILLSAIGMLSSLGWIVFGFVKRNRVTRLFGLGFALFSTSKLFLADLRFLENEQRIVSYFIFGVALLGISYVYQRFDKKYSRPSA